MYESNFGAGYPDWADLKFGFVHSTDIIEQNKNVHHNQDTLTHIWWIGIEKLFLKRHLAQSSCYYYFKNAKNLQRQDDMI